MSKQNTIQLWSIQTIGAWHSIQENGTLIGSKERVDPDYLTSYLWMIKQMKKSIPPEFIIHGHFPVWAWMQHESSEKRRPDLRSTGHLPTGEKGVRIEFDAPYSQILLSDFNGWHFVLNDSYLPKNIHTDDLDVDNVEIETKRSKNDRKRSWGRIFLTPEQIQ